MKTLLFVFLMLISISGIGQLRQPPRMPIPFNEIPNLLTPREQKKAAVVIVANAVGFGLCMYYLRNGSEAQYNRAQGLAIGIAGVSAGYYFTIDLAVDPQRANQRKLRRRQN